MSRGHGTLQRFVLETAGEPMGTDLMTTARRWAKRKGWEDPCNDGSIGSAMNAAFDPRCRHEPPRAAYEGVRRAVMSLAREGLLNGAYRSDDRGRTITYVTLSDAGREMVERIDPDNAWWVSDDARERYVARHR